MNAKLKKIDLNEKMSLYHLTLRKIDSNEKTSLYHLTLIPSLYHLTLNETKTMSSGFSTLINNKSALLKERKILCNETLLIAVILAFLIFQAKRYRKLSTM